MKKEWKPTHQLLWRQRGSHSPSRLQTRPRSHPGPRFASSHPEQQHKRGLDRAVRAASHTQHCHKYLDFPKNTAGPTRQRLCTQIQTEQDEWNMHCCSKNPGTAAAPQSWCLWWALPRAVRTGPSHLSVWFVGFHQFHSLASPHEHDLGVPQPGYVQHVPPDESHHPGGSTAQALGKNTFPFQSIFLLNSRTEHVEAAAQTLLPGRNRQCFPYSYDFSPTALGANLAEHEFAPCHPWHGTHLPGAGHCWGCCDRHSCVLVRPSTEPGEQWLWEWQQHPSEELGEAGADIFLGCEAMGTST